MLGIVAVGVVRESRKFRAPIYRAHRAVIFATAQLSCFAYLTLLGSVVVLVPWFWFRLSRHLETGVARSWCWNGSWFLNCVLSRTVLIKLFVGDHNAYWLMCTSGNISVVTLYSLHSAFTYLLFLMSLRYFTRGDSHNQWRGKGLCSMCHMQSTGAHELEGPTWADQLN